MDILNFIAIMLGAALVLVGIALATYRKKEKQKRRLLDPHRDHLYHYTKPRITNPQNDYSEHRHHSHHHHRHRPEA